MYNVFYSELAYITAAAFFRSGDFTIISNGELEYITHRLSPNVEDQFACTKFTGTIHYLFLVHTFLEE